VQLWLAECAVCVARKQEYGFVWLGVVITVAALMGALAMAWLDRRKS
jgi:hypothetical protein